MADHPRHPLPLDRLAQDLSRAILETSSRGLRVATQWSCELLEAVESRLERATECSFGPLDAPVTLCRARSYFDRGEFERAARTLERAPQTVQSNAMCAFVRLYSLYMAALKAREQRSAETSATVEASEAGMPELAQLQLEVQGALRAHREDGFLWYLRGAIEREAGNVAVARECLLHAAKLFPYNWSAWEDLAGLCEDAATLESLELPDSWMRPFFDIKALQATQQNGQVLMLASWLRAQLPDLRMATLAIAEAQYKMRNLDKARAAFERAHEADPEALDCVDAFSNVLFVLEDRAALAELAHGAVRLDKYSPKVCYAIGNYYGLRGEHERAVLYFRRALRLDPSYVAAWTLLGHEYLEMRNSSAAVEAYRRAVAIAPRDHRAWYGLGQAYELMQMPTYALYYYRPYDARMWLAMGSCYKLMNNTESALTCYRRARAHGDVNGVALAELGRLSLESGREEDAEKYFAELVASRDEAQEPDADTPDVARAITFLLDRCLHTQRLEEAERYALRLQQHPGAAGTRATMVLNIIQGQLEERRRRSSPLAQDQRPLH